MWNAEHEEEVKVLQAQMESERATSEAQREKLERHLVAVSPDPDTVVFSERASIYSERGEYQFKYIF